MESLKVSKPADGSRVLQCGKESLLIGQPPEVLKGLLLHKVPTFNTMVLTDSKEKDGSLLNNLEFPLYYFLFMSNGLSDGKKINLVGCAEDISRIFRLLRLTLLGPTEAELEISHLFGRGPEIYPLNPATDADLVKLHYLFCLLFDFCISEPVELA